MCLTPKLNSILSSYDNDLSKITKAVDWTDYQNLARIKTYYKYDRKSGFPRGFF